MKPSKLYSFISMLFITQKLALLLEKAKGPFWLVLGSSICFSVNKKGHQGFTIISPTRATRVNPSVAIMFAGLLFQYGAGNLLSLPTGFVIELNLLNGVSLEKKYSKVLTKRCAWLFEQGWCGATGVCLTLFSFQTRCQLHIAMHLCRVLMRVPTCFSYE